MNDKKELRCYFRNIRNNISLRTDKTKIITDRLINSKLFKSCYEVFLYFPSGSEVSTFEISKAARLYGKRIAYPRCIDKEGNMEFYFVSSESDLLVGMYGIREPDPSYSTLAKPTADSIVIVPALAFDTDGYRLGYGKGYYDRYLSVNYCKTVGIAFDECVCDRLPRNIYDHKVNCLITDKAEYYID